jgi:hypothetical protein
MIPGTLTVSYILIFAMAQPILALNVAAEDFVVGKNFEVEVRWARNLALLIALLMDAAIVCWTQKNLLQSKTLST